MDNENTGNVVKSTEFKTADDWINRLVHEHCVEKNVGAVEPIEEVKDDEGKVTVPGTRGKKGKDVLNVDAIKMLAVANGLAVKDYPNAGMYRMNIGNMLRAAARKRHGLNLPKSGGLIDKSAEFEFVDAPTDFEVNGTKTHNPDGSKIVGEPVAAE